jgi:hypothetical protein
MPGIGEPAGPALRKGGCAIGDVAYAWATGPFSCISGIPLLYLKLATHAMSPCSPMFVLPVFKGPNAFETFMVQCQLPHVLFTSLEEYKR